MTAEEVLSYLSRQGIELWVDGDKLRYRGVKRTLPPPLVALLRQHKAELQRLLRERKLNPAAPFPLSSTQKAFWFLYQLNPTGSAYIGSLAVSLRGPVLLPALHRAIEQLCQRHAVLRTRIVLYDGGPWQEVSAGPACSLQVIDAAGWTEDALREHLQAETHRPFNLLQEVPARLQLYQRSAEESVLFVCMHHIHTDGWSLGVMLRDLGALYRSAVSGHPAQLPAAPASYADFVSWQQQLLLSPEGETLLTHWMDELAGLPPVLELPTDYPRPKARSDRGARIRWTADPALSHELKRLAARQGVTLNFLLLSVFASLLHRYSGQEDFLIGFPYHGRSEPRWEHAIGCFVNSVPLRVRFPVGITFRALLQDVRQRSHAALAHADYPFPLLVERMRPQRDPSRTPLFQVMFAYENFQGADLVFSALPGKEPPPELGSLFGVPLMPWSLSQQEGQFDLTMTATEVDGALCYSLSYSTDLFAPGTIDRMIACFEQLSRSVIADPEQAVAALPILPEADKQQLLVEWNPEPIRVSQDDVFAGKFLEQAARTPDAPAVVFPGEELTYRQLSERSCQLAHALRALGVGPEICVGLCLDRGLQSLVGVVGVWLAGGAYVPLDPTLPQDRVEYMLADAAVPVLLTQRHHAGRLQRPGVRLIFIDDPAHLSFPTTPPPVQRSSEHLAYCIYTSGSTGRPRGVLVEQGAMINLAKSLRSALAPAPAPPLRVGLSASFSFDATIDQILLLLGGACLHVLPDATRMDAAAFVAYARAHRLDLIDCTPTMLTELVAHGLLADAERAPAWLWVGGEAIPEPLWKVLRAARTTRAINLYGPTEATVDSTFCEIGSGPERPVLGKPFGHVRVYILDAQRSLVPVGVPGEIYLSGPGLSRGYLNLPELTAQRFVEGPLAPGERMYRTGDRARWLPDGNIEYLGRLDFQVKLRGYRIELGEIESVLREQPGVRDCAVVLQEHRPGDKRLVAYVVAHPAAVPSRAELRARLQQRLPDYMVPALFMTLPAFPQTATGKLDRSALPPPQARPEPPERQSERGPPRDALELMLVSLWEELLGVPGIGIQDNFFDLGGHSLLAVRLLARLAEPAGPPIPLPVLFQHQTISELAHYLRQRPGVRVHETVVPLSSLPRSESRTPLFCVHPAGGNVLCYVPLARALGPKQPIYGIQSPPAPGEGPAVAPTFESAAAHYVAQLRKTQPRGPYQLLGWSYGGTLAFEMARQLRQAGQQVALLVLVDAYEPEFARTSAGAAEPQSDRQMLLWFVGDLLQLPTGDAEIQRLVEEDVDPATLLGQLRDRGRLPADMNPGQLTALYETFRRNLKRLRDYQAGPYPDPVVLLRAGDAKTAASDHGWSRLCPDKLEVVAVPGNHYTVLTPPNVQVVAAAVSSRLT